MSITTKNRLLFLVLIPFLLYIATLSIMPLMDPDESRYSEIADYMVDSGDYITPHLNHVVYLEKPPLTFWATAVAFKLFGENEFGARFFSALCAWGCILLSFAIGSFLYDEKTGLYSAAILSTFIYFFALGHMNILDIPLTFFICLAVWAGYRSVVENKPAKGWLYLLYIACALAFLTKGLIGIIFPFCNLVLWLLFSKRWADILKLFSPVGILLLAIITLPWIILAQRANSDFLWFFFVHEHFLRYATKIHNRYHSFLFYLPVVIVGIFPWTAYLVQALPIQRNRDSITVLDKTNRLFLIIWTLFIFAFFSASSSKLVPYIAPMFVPIAVILGHFFKGYEEQVWPSITKGKDILFHFSPVLIQSLLMILLLLWPLFLKDHTEIGGDVMVIHLHHRIGLILLPIVILVLMVFLPDLVKRKYHSGWFSTTYLLSILLLFSLIYPVSVFLSPYKSSYELSQVIKSKLPAGETVYQINLFLYGIESYTDIRTAAVIDFGEMEFGMQKLPPAEKSRYFLSYEDFRHLISQKKGDVYCVTANQDNLNYLRKQFPHLQIIWTNHFYYFFRLPH